MTHPNEVVRKAKTVKIRKSALIGLTPAQYVLYRINRIQNLDIKEEYLKIKIEEITMEAPKPGENCEAVAVVEVTPTSVTGWVGKVKYRIPQIKIESIYKPEYLVEVTDIENISDYNDLAKQYLLPPKSYSLAEKEEGEALSYRLDFNNPFFKGSLRLLINGVEDVEATTAKLNNILGIVGNEE